MKNNKITAEEHDANKLGKRYSARFMEENGWQHYVYYHQANTKMRYSRKIPNRAIGINIIDFVTTTQVHFAVNTFQCS